MNILLISQFLSTTRGGGEYVFSQIANSIAKKGHKVWVLTHEIQDEDYSRFDKNVKIVFVSKVKYQGGLPPTFSQNLRFIIAAVFKGLRIVSKNKIELIHSNNFSPALAGSIISTLTRLNHIICIHDIFSYCGEDYWKKWSSQNKVSKIHGFIGEKFEKMIPKLSHIFIHTVSETSKNDLVKLGEKKPVKIIHNAIENVDSLNLESNPLQFIYIGRLVFYKNLETVIKAMVIVKRSHPDVSLLIVGDGPEKNKLIKLVQQNGISKNVNFLGHIADSEKFEKIASSISFLFPSTCEGFGLVILESFSQNKPVLVSNMHPMCDIVDDKEDGLLLDPYNEQDWAEGMQFLIENPKIAIDMGKKGRKKLELQYSHDAMISNIEMMYEEAIASKSK